MKIIVDRNLCEANGLCVDACPEAFVLDADDQLILRIERPAESLRVQVEHAVRICPRQALSVEE